MATTKETSPAKASVKPVAAFRLRGVSASVFENHARKGDRDLTFYKVALQRSYRDAEGYKTTSSFGRDDLPTARLLLDRAWEFILDQEAGGNESEDEE